MHSRNIYIKINQNWFRLQMKLFIFKALYPLAVIGSSEFVKIGNKMTKGRHYEWGTVSVENESHCDFVKLREMLLSTNMIDLIELTHTKHYQLYRAHRLREMGFRDEDDLEQSFSDSVSIKSPRSRSILDLYHLRRTELNDEIQRKEFDIKEEFVQKVKDKELELRETEKEVTKIYLSLSYIIYFEVFLFQFRSIIDTIDSGGSRLNGMNA